MSVLRWSLDYEKQQYYISEKDYADLLERYRKIGSVSNSVSGVSLQTF